MKITLFFGYSADNAGDMAITVGALDLISSHASDITIFSRFHEGSKSFETSKIYLEKRYKNVKVLSCPFKLERDEGIIKQLKNYTYSLAKYFGLLSNSEVEKSILESDLVLFNGGNLLRCSSLADFIRLKALFHPFKFARSINKPYVILPQSSSEIKKYGEKTLSEMIVNADAVFVREEKSYKTLNEKFSDAKLIQSCDAALFIDYGSNKNDKTLANNIAITVRGFTLGDLKEFEDEKLNTIIQRVSNFVYQCAREGFECTFVVQTVKDKKLTLDIIEYVKSKFDIDCNVFQSNDPVELGLFYSECKLLFGMRLHSIILATANGTPCYGYFDESWGLKNPGFMESFSFEYEFINSSNGIANIENYLKENDEVSRKFEAMTSKHAEKILSYVKRK